jgi:hypothetical protein
MTPGTIGVLALETARYSLFNVALDRVKRPEGTRTLWSVSNNIVGTENPDHSYSMASMGDSVINAQNALVKGMTGDWLWILGDDHQFGEDALIQLLAHDVDIVCASNVMRRGPFEPLIFSVDGKRLSWVDLDGISGLVSVAACGNAGMLIKRRVFEAIPEPWFEWGPEGSPYQGSDLAFCWKARQAGFRVYVDLDTRFGHMAIATFIPVEIGPNKEYGVALQVQGETVAYFKFKRGQHTAIFEQKGLRD